jgi:hypothetical protein
MGCAGPGREAEWAGPPAAPLPGGAFDEPLRYSQFASCIIRSLRLMALHE